MAVTVQTTHQRIWRPLLELPARADLIFSFARRDLVGRYKGSALALMVELLAAGAVGQRFSFEAAEADNKDGGPPQGGEFMLAISPELLAGPDWAEHCEAFFRRFEAIEGARLPGSRRHKNRLSAAPRQINADLVARIRALCN